MDGEAGGYPPGATPVAYGRHESTPDFTRCWSLRLISCDSLRHTMDGASAAKGDGRVVCGLASASHAPKRRMYSPRAVHRCCRWVLASPIYLA